MRPRLRPNRDARSSTRRSIIDSKLKALAAAESAQGKKGQNPTIIDIGARSSYADYLVIVTAYSDRQTNAVADAVIAELKEAHGQRPLSRTGSGNWILIDYGDVVVHVFHEDTRAFYNLDGIWSEAPRVPVPPPSDDVALDRSRWVSGAPNH